VNATESLRQGWFRVTRPEPGVSTIEEPLHEERVKSYLIAGHDRALLLDTGMGVGDMRSLVAGITDLPLIVVHSHAHWDHVGGTAAFSGTTEILIHHAEADDLRRGISNERLRRYLDPARLSGTFPAEFDLETASFPPTEPTGILTGGERFDLGGRMLEVLHTPGHCPGLIVLLDVANGVLFSTDAAYPGALYAQLPDSDLADYVTTMTALAALTPSLKTIYPAHDRSPMEPALLPRMRDALLAVFAGRAPDEATAGTAIHDFSGFSVLTRSETTRMSPS
jgi:glyoxylase-like metal-dependent hydrolase (beta-lactamase superfamily II)